MYFPRNSIKLIRYLCVWRVNSSLVKMPADFNLELPRVLGQLIAEHLPTRAGKPWQRALNDWNDYWQQRQQSDDLSRLTMPDSIWPLQAVFHPYPGKRTYGRGELIFWELKLLANSADHTFFLEMILPAMEEAGYTGDPRWSRPNALWGHFEMEAVYVAKGREWEPVVEDGELDLRYRATPFQWAETQGEEEEAEAPATAPEYRHLHWLTPFDFATPPEVFMKLPAAHLQPEVEQPAAGDEPRPFITDLMEALLTRLERILSAQHKGPVNIWNVLNEAEENALRAALAQAETIKLRYHTLKVQPARVPGRLLGSQSFTPIPPLLLPYLDLAAILHVGEYTQFGCGTFTLT